MSFRVSAIFRVAPLGVGVSVLPLHASLSARNLDTPSPATPGVGRGNAPNQLLAGFAVVVSCMPSSKDLFTVLSMYAASPFLYTFIIHLLPLGAFLLTSL
ncbi:MAG: hypothetical protein ACP5T2_01950 [Thermoprotei archaeon]